MVHVIYDIVRFILQVCVLLTGFKCVYNIEKAFCF